MFVNDFMKTTLSDLNRDLSIAYLERALPGLCFSLPLSKSRQLSQQQPRQSTVHCSRSSRGSAPDSVKSSQKFVYSGLTDSDSPGGSDAYGDAESVRTITVSTTISTTISTAPGDAPSKPAVSTTKPVADHAWSDTDSNVSETEWPDWSRWTMRKPSSSSVDTAISSEGSDRWDLRKRPSERAAPAPPPVVKTCSSCSCTTALHPAKTGFALWVGNLGPRTTLLDLRTLFGTPDLQSIYLIQRTGCAFVNYTSKEALTVAMALFESRGGRLQDHDLVIKAQYTNEEKPPKCGECSESSDEISSPTTSSACLSSMPSTAPVSPAYSPNRYFICKSLLIDDLDQAKVTGQWSTQLRNKNRFNDAFYSAENTYLVFSANRTSAFYGIARLETPFEEPSKEEGGAVAENKDLATAEPEINHTPELVHPIDGAKIPAGDTVLDPLRGSQFWKVCGCQCVEPEVEKWTAPAKITWLSASNSVVPFSRTRQLKNSYNMNKPIKVARDGTEIDPEVGEKLCKMFD